MKRQCDVVVTHDHHVTMMTSAIPTPLEPKPTISSSSGRLKFQVSVYLIETSGGGGGASLV